MKVIYTGAKLASQFNIKDITPKRYYQDIVYHAIWHSTTAIKIILVNVQEDLKKKLTIIMVETKTYVTSLNRN